VKRYDRKMAVAYAHEWAYGRNPVYYDFENLGGDCTNFASQVIYAGSGKMNYKKTFGWYYINANNRTPSWTGVNYLYNFLIDNLGPGPIAKKVDVQDIEPGDIIQLSFVGNNIFNHSLIVVYTGIYPKMENILVATHTENRDYYPLTRFRWMDIRFLHITGVED
jgi:hypothetical protein